jgi:Tol biopolymer transport system component
VANGKAKFQLRRDAMTEQEGHPNEAPVESWKEIAAYLKRDVRTVKRWEKSEGLPVHRQMHQARSSVYAYPSELDSWKIDREPRLNAPILVTPWRRATAALGFALAVLLALGTVASGPILTPTRAAAQQFEGMVTRQVWAAPWEDFLGAATRDGRYLTLQDGRSENLAVHDLATGQKRRLTDKDPRSLEFALASVPSPDGKEVVYGWYNKDNFYDLRIVGLEGSKPRVLYANPELAFLQPTDWSPDGKNILAIFNRKDKSNQMVLVSVRDGSLRVLKAFDRESPGQGRFSPDGRYVVYHLPQQARSNAHDIFLLAVDGGREMPLVRHPANDVVFDWTPDGKRILFGSDRSGTMGAWWIQIADGKPKGTPDLVKPDLGQDVWPMGFTQDGSYYFSVRTRMSDVYIAELDLATGRLLATPRPATQRFVGTNSNPDWSSDGRQLLYLSQRGPGWWGTRAICVRDAESGEVRELASKLERVVSARWSPDGRSLLARASVKDDGFPICRIDVQTGDFERVVQKALGTPPIWSRDGKAIFYYRWNNTAKTASIVARDLATGQEKELYSVVESSMFWSGVALSRDGQQLAFAVRDPETRSKILRALPAAGGEARDLLRGVQLPFPGSVAWSPDGQSVLFVKQPSPGDSKTELWLIPAQGGEPRKLDLTAENMRELSVHPDGRRIAFPAGQNEQAVWVMENFLPAQKASK